MNGLPSGITFSSKISANNSSYLMLPFKQLSEHSLLSCLWYLLLPGLMAITNKHITKQTRCEHYLWFLLQNHWEDINYLLTHSLKVAETLLVICCMLSCHEGLIRTFLVQRAFKRSYEVVHLSFRVFLDFSWSLTLASS